jgi:hypothetical protein
MMIQSFDCYYMCQNCDYTSKQHCVPQLVVELSLILSSERSATTATGEPIATSTASFTKWEELQRSAKELLNTAIRQKYYTTSIATSASHYVQHYVSIVDRWKAYHDAQQVQRNTFRNIGRRNVPNSYNTKQRPEADKNDTTAKWSISELEARLKSIQIDKNESDILLGLGDDVTQEIVDDDRSHNIIGCIRRTSIHDILDQQKQQPVNTANDVRSCVQRQYIEWENISLTSYLMQKVLFHGTILNNDSGSLTSKQNAPNYVTTYYPIPLPFHVRYSFRSKKDVVIHHRPGIVLKPKLNPLDGDSSTSHSSATIGQWYRKDSSAIYTIPQVQVTQKDCYETIKAHATNGEVTAQKRHLLLLQVSNPTLGTIRLRLVLNQSTSTFASRYNHELLHWEGNESDENETIPRASFCNVLLDPLHHIMTDELNVVLLGESQSTSSNDTTAKIELQSMEDSVLLDYPSDAKSRASNDRNAIPDVIEQWGRSKAAHHSDNSDGNGDDENSNPVLRFVAQNASTVWYELSVLDPTIGHHSNMNTGGSFTKTPSSKVSSFGIPMLLEIDVGNGSWESSLIPIQKENDVVRLDLVVVLRK